MYKIKFTDIQQAKAMYKSIVKLTRCTDVSNLFYFGITLRVSDGLSIHHQEFKTVHTATDICQTDTAVCLLASRQQPHTDSS